MIQSVQGMGVVLEQQNMSQVSMNLTDAGACGLLHAFETVKSLASDHGLEVTGSELVGLVPLENVLEAGRWYAPDATSDAERVEAAINGLGLDFGPFDPKSRIIEWALQVGDEMTRAATTLSEFEAAVKSSDPTPGGGTVAAVALGQAAALLSMVAELTLASERWSDAHDAAREAKSVAEDVMPHASRLADADAAAFDAVVAAFKTAQRKRRRETSPSR